MKVKTAVKAGQNIGIGNFSFGNANANTGNVGIGQQNNP
jgi:hypothetical protein